MEYTKDVILGVRYEDGYKLKSGRWTSSLINAIKNHKIITMAVISAVVFISIDVVLVTNFFRVLSLM